MTSLTSDLPSWYEQAACAGMDTAIFFTGSPHRALKVCEQCPVRQPCRDLADAEGHTEGVWGGSTADARREARQQRAA